MHLTASKLKHLFYGAMIVAGSIATYNALQPSAEEQFEDALKDLSCALSKTKCEANNQHFSIPLDVAYAFLRVEAETNLPCEAMLQISARESAIAPDAVNKISGAVGLFQFMVTKKTPTLFYATYLYADKIGYPKAAKLVERYNKSTNKKKPVWGYRAINEDAKQELIEMAKNPLFNARLFAAYTIPEIKKYEAWLGNRKASIGEIVIMNNLGRGGLQSFAKQAWQDKKTGVNTPASKHFSKAIQQQNKSLVFNRDGKAMTVRESYNTLINGFGGFKTLDIQTATLAKHYQELALSLD